MYLVILISFLTSLVIPSHEVVDLSVHSTFQEMQLDTQRIVKFEWDQSHIDLGEVKKGEKKETAFTFTNAGNEEIKIELVSACECTTLDWPRKAIPPGGRGTIDIVFDSGQKEESETIEVDIHLENTDPKTGYPMLEIVSYSFTLLD